MRKSPHIVGGKSVMRFGEGRVPAKSRKTIKRRAKQDAEPKHWKDSKVWVKQ